MVIVIEELFYLVGFVGVGLRCIIDLVIVVIWSFVVIGVVRVIVKGFWFLVVFYLWFVRVWFGVIVDG